LSHTDTVPSAMDSPIWGIGTSTRAIVVTVRSVQVRRLREQGIGNRE
jgi:hypothetical protein